MTNRNITIYQQSGSDYIESPAIIRTTDSGSDTGSNLTIYSSEYTDQNFVPVTSFNTGSYNSFTQSYYTDSSSFNTTLISQSYHSNLLDRDVPGNHSKLIPLTDSTESFQITKADTSTSIFNVDSTNQRIGINKTSPAEQVHIWMTDIDPVKTDQDNDIMVDGAVDSDKGIVWADNGLRKWQTNIYRGENGKYLYFYNFNVGREILVFSETMKSGFNKQSNIMNYHACYMDPTNGLLDDCEFGGTFTNSSITRFEVVITTTGAIDKYKWRKSIDFGQTWTAYSAEIDCHTNEVELASGVTVLFGSVNGHNLFDSWQVNAFPQTPNGTVTIGPPLLNEINTVDDITADPLVYQDLTFALSCNDMPDQIMLKTGDNSAIYCGRTVSYENLFIDVITAGAGVDMIVEYWNGSAWTEIDTTHHLVDGTNNLTIAGNIGWDKGLLTGWVKRFPEYNPAEDGYELYWIRIRSNTTITQSPIIRSISNNGNYRLALFAAHNDSRPCFYVDAKGRTVIGDAKILPTSDLTINGSVGNKMTEVSGSYTIASTDNIIECVNTGLITLDFPSTNGIDGRTYRIALKGTDAAIFSPYAGDTIEGNLSSLTGIVGKTYLFIADDNNSTWRIINNVKNIIASEIAFTPTGSISSTTVQNAVQEVSIDASQSLYEHVINYNNPHHVSASQVEYTNTVYNTALTKTALDQFAQILNNTQGTGLLLTENVIWNPVGLFPTIVGIRSGSGYINYNNVFKEVSWPSSSIDFTSGSYTTNSIHYIYSDINGNILTSTSEPNVRENLLLGSAFWNGQTAMNFVQSSRISKESLTAIFDYLTKLGIFIYDNGCLVSVQPGGGNELKIVSAAGNSLRGLKSYNHLEIKSDTDLGTAYFPLYNSTNGWDVLYYELYNQGNIPINKWNDTSKSHHLYITSSVTFINGSTTASCADDLTDKLSVGDMIWLESDTIQVMNNIEAISYTGSTTMSLTIPYQGAGGSGTASYSQAYPNVPSGSFVKHMLVRSLDDILYFIPGQTLYATEGAAIADGAPTIPTSVQTTAIMLAFITVNPADTTLVGKLQDIRPLPFSYKIGGSTGGGVSNSHSSLTDLTNDDHLQYLLTNGGRLLTGIQKYQSHPSFSLDTDLIDKKYGDDLMGTHLSTYNHVDIAHGADVKKYHGFENRTDSTIPLILTTNEFSITGSNFNIWIDGVNYQKNTEAVPFDNINGVWYIKYNAAGNITSSQTPWSIYNDVPIAYVIWNGVEGLVHEERHNHTRDLDWHNYQHFTNGAKYESGLDGTFNNTGFLITSGTFYDEDIANNISNQNKCRILYQTGSDWTWTPTQSLYFYTDGSDIYYNSGSVLTPMTDNYFVTYWIFATNDVEYPIYSIPGNRQDALIDDCIINNRFENLQMPPHAAEFKILYKVVLQNSATPYQSVSDYRSYSSLPGLPGIPHRTLVDRDSPGAHPALSIYTDTTYFSGLLTAADDQLQKALNTLSAVTIATLGIGNVTNDAQLKRSADDFISFPSKSAIVAGDKMLIEDSEASGSKKYVPLGRLMVTASNLGSGYGVFKTKNDIDLQFKSIVSASNKLSLTNNANDITFDVNEAFIDHQNLSGSGTNTHTAIDNHITTIGSFTQSYYTDSQSFDSRINTKLNTSDFNSFTQSSALNSQSFNTRINNLNIVSSSLNSFTQSYLTDSQSFDSRIDSKLNTTTFNSFTQSYGVDSSSFNTRIDNKLETTTFNSLTQSFNLVTQSLNSATQSISALNVFTQSYYTDSQSFNSRINTKLDTTAFNLLSQSFNTHTQSYLTDSSSFDTRITNVSQSVYTISSSFDTRIKAKVESSSFNSHTASFNTFTQSYLTDSQSFDTRLKAVDTSSFLQIGNFNAFTQSYQISSQSWNLIDSQKLNTASYLIDSQSFNSRLVELEEPAYFYFSVQSNTAITPIAAAGTYYKANITGSSVVVRSFTPSNSNSTFTYTGPTISGSIYLCGSFRTTNNARVLIAALYQNGILQKQNTVYSPTANQPVSFNIVSHVTASNNDSFDLYVVNVTAANNIVVYDTMCEFKERE